MGLSCYGKHDIYLKKAFNKILKPLSARDGFFESDPTYRYNYKRSYGNRFSDKLVDFSVVIGFFIML